MQKNTRLATAGLILAAATALSGCSGSGTEPSAKVRTIDVATNVLDTANSNKDAGSVLVNGAPISTTNSQYGAPTPYQFVEAKNSSFQGRSYLTLPLYTDPTTSTTTAAPLPVIHMDVTDGQRYTAYLVGRRDVKTPLTSDFSDLDTAHYLNVIVLPDNQNIPPVGQANVRVLVAGPDIPAVDVLVNGSAPAGLTNLVYSPTGTATVDVPVTAGTPSFSVNAAGTTTVIVPAKTLNLSAGSSYTLVVTEPTGAASPGNTPATPPVVTTYGLTLVQN
jgi:hypothetical protein